MARGEQQLDLRIEVQTPENIAFQYRLAGPFRRLPAFLIDVAIRALLTLIVGLLFAMTFSSIGLGGLGIGMGLSFWFAMSWFYGAVFETYWNGQTPGKWILGLRVVCVDGQPINGVQAVLRNILRAADALPVVPFPGSDLPVPVLPLFQVGLLTPLFNERYQRLGDLVSGTMVVVEEKQHGATMIQVKEPAAIQLASQLPANLQVSRSLGRGLTKYVSRRAVFSLERRSEIARRLGEALIRQYNLSPQTNYDLLLCALYYRAFMNDRTDTGQESPRLPRETSKIEMSYR